MHLGTFIKYVRSQEGEGLSSADILWTWGGVLQMRTSELLLQTKLWYIRTDKGG